MDILNEASTWPHSDTRIAPVSMTIGSRVSIDPPLTRRYLGVYEYISDTLIAIVDDYGSVYRLTAVLKGGGA